MIERPPFSKETEVPKLQKAGRVLRNHDTKKPLYYTQQIENSAPNIDFIRKNNITLNSEPYECFNTFLSL